MSAKSVRPSVADMEFHLFGRPLHPELIEPVAVRQFEHANTRIRIQITRTGHVISWDHTDVHLTEFTGASDHSLPTMRCLLKCRFVGEQARQVECARGFRYQLNSQVESVSSDVFHYLHEEIMADGRQRGLLYCFPAKHRLHVAPLGYVHFEAQADCLFFSSIHTFPDELTIIKTQSLIESEPANFENGG